MVFLKTKTKTKEKKEKQRRREPAGTAYSLFFLLQGPNDA